VSGVATHDQPDTGEKRNDGSPSQQVELTRVGFERRC
jgi:hypothetical protein